MEAKEEGEKERNERYQKNMKTRSEKISLKKYNNSETHSIMSLLVKGFFFLPYILLQACHYKILSMTYTYGICKKLRSIYKT